MHVSEDATRGDRRVDIVCARDLFNFKGIAMSLIRWEPFGAADDVFNRMPSLFGRWPVVTAGNRSPLFDWSPSVNISETNKEYLIRAEMPAVKKEDVHVTFGDGMITISGERKQKEEEKSEKVHRVESFYGTFSRSFSLPDTVDATAIRAESKDGVLTVRVPKAKTEEKKPTEVKVQ
jgi:HSP20 family protein